MHENKQVNGLKIMTSSLVTKFLELDDLRGLFALNWKLKFGHLQEIWSYALIFGLRSSWTGGIRLYELSIYNRYLSSFNIFSFIISKNRCDLTTQRTNVCIVIVKSLDYNTTFYSNGSWGQCHKTFLTLMAISQNNKKFLQFLCVFSNEDWRLLQPAADAFTQRYKISYLRGYKVTLGMFTADCSDYEMTFSGKQF